MQPLAGEGDNVLAESNEDDEIQGYTLPRAASRSADDLDNSHNSYGDEEALWCSAILRPQLAY